MINVSMAILIWIARMLMVAKLAFVMGMEYLVSRDLDLKRMSLKTILQMGCKDGK